MQQYRWTKVWAVQTDLTDDVQAGDLIEVSDRNGGSYQRVQSVTVMMNKSGRGYKTLMLKAEEQFEGLTARDILAKIQRDGAPA